MVNSCNYFRHIKDIWVFAYMNISTKKSKRIRQTSNEHLHNDSLQTRCGVVVGPNRK